MRRGVITGALIALAFVSAGRAGGTAAQARIEATQGAVGVSGPGGVSCYYSNYRASLVTRANPPTVYAFNRYAGGGNDWQQVRYQVRYYDAATGAYRGGTGWSGFAWAGDNQPAAWSGAADQTWKYNSLVMVGFYIEVYSSAGQFEGSVLHVKDTYQNYQEGNKAGVSNGRCLTAWN